MNANGSIQDLNPGYQFHSSANNHFTKHASIIAIKYRWLGKEMSTAINSSYPKRFQEEPNYIILITF